MNKRVLTPDGDSGNMRYVIEFKKQATDDNPFLLLREGDSGKIRFNGIKIEKLER